MDGIYLLSEDTELLSFSPEIVRDAAAGFLENVGTAATFALALFLVLLGVYLVFGYIRNLFQ